VAGSLALLAAGLVPVGASPIHYEPPTAVVETTSSGNSGAPGGICTDNPCPPPDPASTYTTTPAMRWRSRSGRLCAVLSPVIIGDTRFCTRLQPRWAAIRSRSPLTICQLPFNSLNAKVRESVMTALLGCDTDNMIDGYIQRILSKETPNKNKIFMCQIIQGLKNEKLDSYVIADQLPFYSPI
jgi:hypothetical protein